MALLLDIFGFLVVVLHGVALVAQAIVIGGIVFAAALAEPLAGRLGDIGRVIARRSTRLTGQAALALVLAVGAMLAANVAILIESSGVTLATALGAGFAIAGFVKIAIALAVFVLCRREAPAPRWLLPALGLSLLAAAAVTTHGWGRIDGRLAMTATGALHIAASAAWIGGIPHFLIALAGCRDGSAWREIGRRFSLIAMAAVAALLCSGVILIVTYLGALDAFYGTAYGLMTSAKMAMFAGLLALGAANYRLVERLRRDPSTPINRLRRFAEAELGIGITVFFAAASLTSLPPAVDLTLDRVSIAEIVERNVPRWPRLQSPDHATLAIPSLQAQLDAAAAAAGKTDSIPRAYVPGAGQPSPTNPENTAWSEYNHNWAGIIVLTIGLLGAAAQSGRAPWARNWPLVFLVLAGFLLIRSDPESWPLGPVGFFESFRDPDVVQHRIVVVLLVVFALFEWGVRTERIKSARLAAVFPLLTAIGATVLLTHTHALANVKEELLIELTHAPMALFGVAAAWSRWLELRLDPPGSRIAGWVWPACFAMVGLFLIFYRES